MKKTISPRKPLRNYWCMIHREGEFLGKDNATIPAKAGDVVISEISEPHGLRAKTDLRLLVTIAPPI